MAWQVTLIAIALTGGYWGVFGLRQGGARKLTFPLMLLGAALCSVLGLVGQERDDRILELLGAVGVGAGGSLLLIGPTVRRLARWALAGERFELARILLRIADVLQPGTGAADEARAMTVMRDVRNGNVDEAVASLRQARRQLAPPQRRAIDERIAMLYVIANRWRDAITHGEAHLLVAAPVPAPTASPPEAPAEVTPGVVGPVPPTWVVIAQDLDMTPTVWVELLGAYARIGDLDRAATMLIRLEAVAQGRDDASPLLHRGRLMVLAAAGRVAEVEALVAVGAGQPMSRAARRFWVGLATYHAGDATTARHVLAEARSKTRRGSRPRSLVDEALGAIERSPVASVATSPAIDALIARLAASPLPAWAPVRVPRSWAMPVLLALIVVPSVIVSLTLGSIDDLGVLLDAGASWRSAIQAGQAWRLATSILLHAGLIHLVVNAIGLWSLGRLADAVFGSLRTVVVFFVAALVGATASYVMSPSGISLGASGGVMGLLGAILVELTVHRRGYRQAHRTGVWGSLVAVAVGQIALGMFYPVIDQWAHVGGLLGGALCGFLLGAPTRIELVSSRRLRDRVALVVAVVIALGLGGSVVMAARTRLPVTLASLPRHRELLAGWSVEAPTGWEVHGDELAALDIFVVLTIDELTPEASALLPLPAAGLQARADAEVRIAHERGFPRVRNGPPIVVLPAGWQSVELVGLSDDGNAETEYRVVIYQAIVGGRNLQGTLYVPRWMVTGGRAFLLTMLGSLTP